MEKKYQIFVSSTYTDLLEERAAVTEAIVKMKHIPIAMEFFSASNLSQLEYIKKLLDYVDYYVLIVGGRYGSEDETGKSFTQLEFEYALDKSIPIIFFFPKHPEKITRDKIDDDPKKKDKLEDFIKIAMKNRLAYAYEDPKDLQSSFIISLNDLISEVPRTGWIRGDNDSSVDLLVQLNNVRKENEELKNKVDQYVKGISNSNLDLGSLTDLAGTEDNFVMHYDIKYETYHQYSGHMVVDHETNIKDLLSSFGYNLVEGFSKQTVSDCLIHYLNSEALDFVKNSGDALTYNEEDYSYNVIINNKTLMQILVSLEVNGIIYSEINDIYWLTEKGKKIVYEALVFKKNPEVPF